MSAKKAAEVVEPTPEADPAPAISYAYDGPGFHLGVPARDLTDEDVARLEAGPRADLEASAHYHRVGVPQTDPNVSGRSDSDTIMSGLGVPPADEPKGENAPGFVQGDTLPGGFVLPNEG
jgi:hypothetical protein